VNSTFGLSTVTARAINKTAVAKAQKNSTALNPVRHCRYFKPVVRGDFSKNSAHPDAADAQ
jgi:hypothetical protein